MGSNPPTKQRRDQNRGENGLQDDSSRKSMDAGLEASGVRSTGVFGRGEISAGAGSTARSHRRRRETVPPPGGGNAMGCPVTGFRRVIEAEAVVFMPCTIAQHRDGGQRHRWLIVMVTVLFDENCTGCILPPLSLPRAAAPC
jgi:hypothetical protein